MRYLKWAVVVVAVAGVSAAGGAGLAGCQCRGGGPGDTLMLDPDRAGGGVGVVRRTDLLIAYHRSQAHADPLRRLKERHGAAGAAGDESFVRKSEAFGAMWQEISHRQLARKEPLYTVVLAVREDLEALMARHGLSQIVEAGPGVEGLDITDELITALTPPPSAPENL